MARKERIEELGVLCEEILRCLKEMRAGGTLDRTVVVKLILEAKTELFELWDDLEPEVAQNWAKKLKLLDEIYEDTLQLSWLER